MTAIEINEFVATRKAEGFSPTQVKMQLARKGAKNDQINSIGKWQVVWKRGKLQEVIDR